MHPLKRASPLSLLQASGLQTVVRGPIAVEWYELKLTLLYGYGI
jgi:hypothetical protein